MKSQTPSTKVQTNLKFQYSMTKTQNRFGISNFGHCDLFVICYLLFGISFLPVLQKNSQSFLGGLSYRDSIVHIYYLAAREKPPSYQEEESNSYAFIL
jgi:hypothetical protein